MIQCKNEIKPLRHSEIAPEMYLVANSPVKLSEVTLSEKTHAELAKRQSVRLLTNLESR